MTVVSFLFVSALIATLVLLQGLASARGVVAEWRLPVAPSEEQVVGAARDLSAQSGWQTVFTETFGSGLGPKWNVTGAGASGSYVWGTSTFTSVEAGRSAWCAGGTVDAGELYTDGMSTWLISEPIDLGASGRRVWGAGVHFGWWLDANPGEQGEAQAARTMLVEEAYSPPSSGDWFGWGILTGGAEMEDGTGPGGQWTYVSGGTAGWTQGWIPLDDFLPLTDGVTSTVRIVFHFVSDHDGLVGRGAFVDRVTVRANYGYRAALPLIANERPVSTPTPTPSSLLRNGSFEDGWYDIVIGQAPSSWRWHWVDGETLPGSVVQAAAPETRVLPQDQVPSDERDVFFLDGEYCVKVFKSGAPIYAALSQDVTGLEVGRRYLLMVPIYVDVFTWEGKKVPPSDPWAAQVRLGAASPDAAWRDGEVIAYSEWRNGDNTEDFYLSYNVVDLEFVATRPEMKIYVELLAKWGLDNNGFLMDDLVLLPFPAVQLPRSAVRRVGSR